MIQSRTAQSKVLTTGQIARICNVAPRTVSKWFDLGQLRGYRIPGSRDRRVPIDQLIRFMKAHNMPLNGLDAGPRRVLLMHGDIELSQTIVQRLRQSGYEAVAARDSFEAGMLVERLRPHILLLDDANRDHLAEVVSGIRCHCQAFNIKLVVLTEAKAGDQSANDVDIRLVKPFTAGELIDTLNHLA